MPFVHLPQAGFGSNTLLQKFTPHFKILDPRLSMFPKVHEELYVLSSNSKYELYLRITCKRESEREIEDAHP